VRLFGTIFSSDFVRLFRLDFFRATFLAQFFRAISCDFFGTIFSAKSGHAKLGKLNFAAAKLFGAAANEKKMSEFFFQKRLVGQIKRPYEDFFSWPAALDKKFSHAPDVTTHYKVCCRVHSGQAVDPTEVVGSSLARRMFRHNVS
jgi:hypothetical protein